MPLDDALDAAQGERDGRDPRLVRLERLAHELHGEGLDFAVERGKVVVGSSPTDRDHEVEVDFGKEHIRLGIVSDTHQGSKFEQLTALRAFYQFAEDEGVDAFVHCGDMTQGPDKMHRDQFLGVHAHGADAQVDYVVATYPRTERRTYVITGNHDDSFLAGDGTNVVRQITGRRDDMVYVGQDAAYLAMGGLRMYLMHPDGGVPYAKSYRLQKIATSLPLEPRVRLALIGHYHTYASIREHDTHVLGLPCFQSQYSWLARKALHPDIGGLLVDLWLDDAGRLARIRHEFVSFPVLEDDWDREVSREIDRAWSPRGLEVPAR